MKQATITIRYLMTIYYEKEEAEYGTFSNR